MDPLIWTWSGERTYRRRVSRMLSAGDMTSIKVEETPWAFSAKLSALFQAESKLSFAAAETVQQLGKSRDMGGVQADHAQAEVGARSGEGCKAREAGDEGSSIHIHDFCGCRGDGSKQNLMSRRRANDALSPHAWLSWGPS